MGLYRRSRGGNTAGGACVGPHPPRDLAPLPQLGLRWGPWGVGIGLLYESPSATEKGHVSASLWLI
jgi:hypothetical protein